MNIVFSTDCFNTKICHVFNAGMLLGKDTVAPILTLACEWDNCQLHASVTLPPWGKSYQYPLWVEYMVTPTAGLGKKEMYLAPDGKEPWILSPANNLSILTELWNNTGHSKLMEGINLGWTRSRCRAAKSERGRRENQPLNIKDKDVSSVKLKNFGVGQVEYTFSEQSYKHYLLTNHMWMEGSMAQPLEATTKCGGREILLL